MTRRLFIGPVPDDFDPTRDRAAGPWCFAGRESVCADWELLDFVEPFDTPGKLIAAEAQIAALVDDRVAEWADRLNDAHGLHRPYGFWRRYLSIWLWFVAMAAWARWRNTETLVERFGGDALEVPVLAGDEPDRNADFPTLMYRTLSDPGFQWRMDSAILALLAPPAWMLVPATPPAAVPDPAPAAPRKGTAALIRRMLPRLAFDHLPGVARGKPFYSLLLAVAPRRPAVPVEPPPAAAAESPFPTAFLEFFDGFLAHTAPDSIVGARFAALDREAARLRCAPGRLYVTNSRSPSDRERLIAAHAEMAGERLVNAQHGGWEGTAATVPWNRQAYGEDHAFLTWGWERQAYLPGRCLPFLAPALGALRDRHRERNAELLLVGARLAINGMRFDCVPRPRAMLRYRADKVRFLRALPDAVRPSARYRPYTRDRVDLEDGPYVLSRVPEVRSVDGDFDAAMTGCRLLALDHPGTTMHRAMAANVPMVCFWNRDDWPLCDEARPYFDALRDAGVLFHDPVEAAQRAGEIWDDVRGWWMRPEVVEAVGAWRHQFARTGPNVGLALAGTLWRLSRMGPNQARDAMPIPNGRWYASQTNSRVVH